MAAFLMRKGQNREKRKSVVNQKKKLEWMKVLRMRCALYAYSKWKMSKESLICKDNITKNSWNLHKYIFVHVIRDWYCYKKHFFGCPTQQCGQC